MGKEKEQGEGMVKIADQVVAVIAGIAAAEIEGVALAGNISADMIGKLGKKKLAKGVRISITEGIVFVDLTLAVAYGCSIPKTCKAVQEKVSAAVENMTGLPVASVNIKVTGIGTSQEA